MKITKGYAILILSIISVGTIVGVFAFIDFQNSKNRLILATTTSTYDSGLLDYILPTFEDETSIKVEILSVGTGQAISNGENGDADLILVHSRSREDAFVEAGHGVNRTCIMYNDFVIVGPDNDPANISGTELNISMARLRDAGNSGEITFYSRGDNSGTHSKELSLWNNIAFTPDSSSDTWYKELGQGMGATLAVADENQGYTLVDRGTWLASKNNVDLEILVEGDTILLNPYGAILVNPEKYPTIKFDLAVKLIGFLTSELGQTMIGNFRKNGEILFRPAFGICNSTHDCQTTQEEIDIWKNYNGNYIGPISSSNVFQTKSTISNLCPLK